MSNETTIREKLIAAQADMTNPVKSKAVKAGARSYNYEVLSDVLEIVADALHAHGLGLTQGVYPAANGYELYTGVTDGQESLILDQRPLDFPDDPQAAGSKETYARRYALKTAFGLAGVDDDGEAAHQMAVRAPQTPSKAPSAPVAKKTLDRALEQRMHDLIRAAKAKGLDVDVIGKRISVATGKKSTQYGDDDFRTAIGILEATLREAENIGD